MIALSPHFAEHSVAFLHGGTTSKIATFGCVAINSKVKSELGKLKLSSPEIGASLMAGPDGPLWYRGLVKELLDVDADAITGILGALHVRAMVVGHTVADGGHIRQTFDGRVTQIDTGMLGAPFWPDGAPSALEIKDKTFTAIYAGGRREPLSAPAAATYAAHR